MQQQGTFERDEEYFKHRYECVTCPATVFWREEYPNGRLEPGPGGGEGGPGGLFVSGSIGLAASAAARHNRPSLRGFRAVDLSAAAAGHSFVC